MNTSQRLDREVGRVAELVVHGSAELGDGCEFGCHLKLYLLGLIDSVGRGGWRHSKC